MLNEVPEYEQATRIPNKREENRERNQQKSTVIKGKTCNRPFKNVQTSASFDELISTDEDK